MNGLLLIDKPAGITSHDAVDWIRRRFQIRRVGHGGTLDPAATGLLILLVGEATRQASTLLGADKSYRATLRLGIVTDTQDGEGKILQTRPVGQLSLDQIQQACARFQGEIQQKIPAYSTVRIQGKRSYELARAGIPIPARSRTVRIDELKILGCSLPDLDLEIRCSKGTYIRTLCEDLGEALGCGGHLAQLRRTRVGPFSIEEAIRLEEVQPGHLISVKRIGHPELVEG
ncbi:MAG: tRNA pseudouridine(55) synthase TruB [Candidatus Omnitrophica bacterium]|nr:tRNA pseudouridine(55) synthase TruB [Candidatus Omnitrophota bacterium]